MDHKKYQRLSGSDRKEGIRVMSSTNYVLIKIGGSNGTKLPAPSEYEVSYEDLDSEESKRYVTTGVMRRKRIRSNVMKVTLTYPATDISSISTVSSSK